MTDITAVNPARDRMVPLPGDTPEMYGRIVPTAVEKTQDPPWMATLIDREIADGEVWAAARGKALTSAAQVDVTYMARLGHEDEHRVERPDQADAALVTLGWYLGVDPTPLALSADHDVRTVTYAEVVVVPDLEDPESGQERAVSEARLLWAARQHVEATGHRLSPERPQVVWDLDDNEQTTITFRFEVQS